VARFQARIGFQLESLRRRRLGHSSDLRPMGRYRRVLAKRYGEIYENSGGASSPALTFLRSNSLLTGKNAGNLGEFETENWPSAL
jgi:hypothetical protein